jgi:hypothetical protein
MRQVALELLQKQREREKASKSKRSAQDVMAAVDGSETNAVHSDDEAEVQEAVYQPGSYRPNSGASGSKAKKVASKSWKSGEDQIIKDMVANPPSGKKDILSELESALKIRSIGQIRHRMKVLGIEAPKRSRLHRSKAGSSSKNSSRNSIPWDEEMDAIIRREYIPEEDHSSQLSRLVVSLLGSSSLPERARAILRSSPTVAAQKVSRRVRHLGLSNNSERRSTRRLERAQASNSDQSSNSDVTSSSSESDSDSEVRGAKVRPAKSRTAPKVSNAAQEQLCAHLVAQVASSGNESLVAGLVWLRTRFEAASRQEDGRVSLSMCCAVIVFVVSDA